MMQSASATRFALLMLLAFACYSLPAATPVSEEANVAIRHIVAQIRAHAFRLFDRERETAKSGLQCALSFAVRKDGTLQKVEVEKSSGVAAFDDLCVKAIQGAAPFGELPDSTLVDSTVALFRIRLRAEDAKVRSQ